MEYSELDLTGWKIINGWTYQSYDPYLPEDPSRHPGNWAGTAGEPVFTFSEREMGEIRRKIGGYRAIMNCCLLFNPKQGIACALPHFNCDEDVERFFRLVTAKEIHSKEFEWLPGDATAIFEP